MSPWNCDDDHTLDTSDVDRRELYHIHSHRPFEHMWFSCTRIWNTQIRVSYYLARNIDLALIVCSAA
jgi:hypothetical protein